MFTGQQKVKNKMDDESKNIICYTINPEVWQGTVFLYNPEKYDIIEDNLGDMKEAKEIIERIMNK